MSKKCTTRRRVEIGRTSRSSLSLDASAAVASACSWTNASCSERLCRTVRSEARSLWRTSSSDLSSLLAASRPAAASRLSNAASSWPSATRALSCPMTCLARLSRARSSATNSFASGVMPPSTSFMSGEGSLGFSLVSRSTTGDTGALGLESRSWRLSVVNSPSLLARDARALERSDSRDAMCRRCQT